MLWEISLAGIFIFCTICFVVLDLLSHRYILINWGIEVIKRSRNNHVGAEWIVVKKSTIVFSNDIKDMSDMAYHILHLDEVTSCN
jgi:hypothetical protein